MEPEMSPAMVLRGLGWPPRPRLAIWLALLVPDMPTLLNPRPSPSPSPSPRLDAGLGPDVDWG